MKKDHILYLYKRKAHCDENSTTLKDTLEKDINTAFKGQQKYIFELLQNADDSGNENEVIEVKFVLVSHEKNNYLIFSHTGKHFDEKDVERICSNAQQGSESKTKEAQKIGYKGIGFKAVFSIADCVYILSNQYQFRFDKHYPKWQTGTPLKGYPWPIIPIWTERHELPPALLKQIDDKAVNFIIQLRSDVDVTSDLNTILKTPEISLFLRRVKLIHIQYSQQSDIIKLINSEGNIQELYLNNKIHSRWLTHKIIFDIPPEMKETLRKMNDYECPVRLKEASQTQILFAAKLTLENDIERLKKSIIYSYLPTQTSLNLPFLVNAEFLLNADRTEILWNAWNKSLAEAIGIYQFWWLEELNQDARFRYKILKLLYLPSSHDAMLYSYMPHPSPIQTSLDMSAEQGLSEIAVLPSSQDPNHLIVVKQGYYDAVGFFDYFSTINKPENLINPELENVDYVKSVLKKYLSVDVFCKELENYASQNKSPEFQLKLMKFLQQKPLDKENWELYLSRAKFILSAKNIIVSPKDVYINTKTDFPIPEALDLNFIHPALGGSETSTWLLRLGAHTITPKEIVQNHIEKMIRLKQFNDKNIVPITEFLVKLFIRKKLTKHDVAVLSELPILTSQKQLRLPARTFFSDRYKPVLLLQRCVPHQLDIFVSEAYIDFSSSDKNLTPEDWREFFLVIGVQEDIKFFIRNERYTVGEARAEKSNIFEGYLSRLRDNNMTAKTIQPQHYFNNFFDCNLLGILNTPETLTVFWRKLILQWQLFTQDNNISYHTLNHQVKPVTLSLIEYFIQSFPSVPGTDGKLYRPEQIYAPNFLRYQKLLPELIVANLPMELNEEQLYRLGFKTQLSAEHCISILKSLNLNHIKDAKIYSEILLQLLQTQQPLLTKEDLRLLNQSGELIPIQELHCFAIPGKVPPANSKFWLKPLLGLSLDEQIAICKLLNIKIIGENNIKFSHTALTEDKKTKEYLLSRIALIARVEATCKNSSEIQLLEAFKQKIQVLNFYVANRLTFSYKNIPDSEITIFAHLDRNRNLYINKRWSNESTLDKFCQTLADYLELSQTTREHLRAMLKIGASEIQSWLVENQFPIDIVEMPIATINLSNTEETKLQNVAPNFNNESTVSENHGISFFAEEPSQESDNALPPPFIFSTPEKPHKEEIFFKATNKYDYSQVNCNPALLNALPPAPTYSLEMHFKNLNLNKNSPPSSPAPKSPEAIREIFQISPIKTLDFSMSSSVDSRSIGRWGEQFVFNKLTQHYQQKYPNYAFSLTNNGFRLTNKNSKIGSFHLEVQWVNQSEETGKPYDLLIQKNDITRVIEVKTTLGSKKSEFTVSQHEFAVMEEYKKRYRIFRVNNAGQDNAEIKKIKDPAQKIKNRELSIKSYIFKL